MVQTIWHRPLCSPSDAIHKFLWLGSKTEITFDFKVYSWILFLFHPYFGSRYSKDYYWMLGNEYLLKTVIFFGLFINRKIIFETNHSFIYAPPLFHKVQSICWTSLHFIFCAEMLLYIFIVLKTIQPKRTDYFLKNRQVNVSCYDKPALPFCWKRLNSRRIKQ